MESRKSKKTRSYGDGSKTSRDSHSTHSPPLSGLVRPQLKDRVKSAPLIAQSTKTKHEGRAKYASNQPPAGEGEYGHAPTSVSGYPATYIAGQQESCTQTSSTFDSVSARYRLEYRISYLSYNGHVR